MTLDPVSRSGSKNPKAPSLPERLGRIASRYQHLISEKDFSDFREAADALDAAESALDQSREREAKLVGHLRVAQNFMNHRDYCPASLSTQLPPQEEVPGPCICGLDEIDQQIHDVLIAYPLALALSEEAG